MCRRRRLQDLAREERASESGVQEGFAAAPSPLQGTVATKAVRKSALGLSCRTTHLELMVVEYLAAEVPESLPRAPADVGPIKRGEDIVAAASWGVIALFGVMALLWRPALEGLATLLGPSAPSSFVGDVVSTLLSCFQHQHQHQLFQHFQHRQPSLLLSADGLCLRPGDCRHPIP